MSAETVRLLRLIGEQKVRLGADGGLTLSGAKSESAVRLTACRVRALVSEGLVIQTDRMVARSAAGRAYLRRALCTVADAGYAAQHRAEETRHVDGIAVAVNTRESPLAWLATRKDRDGRPMISAAAFEAGQRLHCDHERGHQRARVTQSWDASGVHADGPRERMSVGEAAAAARRRVEMALEEVGPGFAEVLVAVCCQENGLEDVEKRHRWPARSGKVVLRLALDRLAAHYGIGTAATGRPARQLLQWGTADYRPSA